jgi:putative DNA methylase
MNTSFSPRGWHNRGYLPHFDGGEIIQFITLRLADSVPNKVINTWQSQLQFESVESARFILEERIEKYLDNGFGECWLKGPPIATVVEDSLKHFDGTRYDLLSWVIMPNHTHFMIRPKAGFDLSSILKNHKSFTAKESNKIIGRQGQFWQEDYFDRRIRDSNHYIDTLEYIDFNPVNAGLCRNPREWRFGSARFDDQRFNE